MSLIDVERLAVLLAALTFVFAVGGTMVFAVRVRRRLRRRRGLRSILRRSSAPSLVSRVGGGLAGTVSSASWWLVQRDRLGMWRSIAAAQRAVAVAAHADAPVGELPVLMRQLRRAARGVDATLRAAGADRQLAREVAAERSRIEATAADVRAAAVASVAATRVDVQPVLSAVAVEIAAVAEGARSARSTRLPSHNS